jgi:hypothetical protein
MALTRLQWAQEAVKVLVGKTRCSLLFLLLEEVVEALYTSVGQPAAAAAEREVIGQVLEQQRLLVVG